MRVFLAPLLLALAACAPAPQGVQVASLATAPVVDADVAPADAPAPAVGPFTPPRFGKALLVNIPSQEVIAFEDGVEVLRSRAVVGATATQTPIADSVSSVVRFRPSWRPTPRMVASGAYEDRLWPPGSGNPLGLAAIRLEQGNLIYLHGTNRPDLFDRAHRALSNGCVRVERLAEVIAWLLDAEPRTVDGWMRGRRSFDVETGGAPVFFRYYTRFPDADGVMREHRDVYGLGPEILLAAL